MFEHVNCYNGRQVLPSAKMHTLGNSPNRKVVLMLGKRLNLAVDGEMDGCMGSCADGCRDESGGSDGPHRVPPLFNPLFSSPEALRHSGASPEIGGPYFHLLLCVNQREDKLN